MLRCVLIVLTAAQGSGLDASGEAKAREDAQKLYGQVKDYSTIPRDLFCDTCRQTAKLVQDLRAAAIVDDPRQRFVHHLAKHLKRVTNGDVATLCNEFQFQNLAHDPFQMEVRGPLTPSPTAYPLLPPSPPPNRSHPPKRFTYDSSPGDLPSCRGLVGLGRRGCEPPEAGSMVVHLRTAATSRAESVRCGTPRTRGACALRGR